MINKIFDSFDEAVADIPDGATIMIGGFGDKGGLAINLVAALWRQGAKNLTLISNFAGYGPMNKVMSPPDGYIDQGHLFENRQVKRIVGSFPIMTVGPMSKSISAFEKQHIAGEVELEIYPQGTLAEKIRAGGGGLGGFYTPVGLGTLVEEGKEKKVINGKEYILELSVTADYALVRALKADTLGNLVYYRTMRSFNPIMASAAKVTIAEVDEIVQPGELDPDIVVTPTIYVDRIVKRPEARK